ncbi:uncharacterized protein [Triticum aestivum]|uniref:uncharacterized protein n=1 Tax=Triticum aestivum TaxID=4565 RepID=UPI001D0237CE|nr:uncharacterized protein LOC123072094 [Triticum aestivum]
MRIASRRRLTLAPCWSPAPPLGGLGSRFSCLAEAGAEEAAPLAEDMSTDVHPMQSGVARRRKTDDELAKEFWVDIGYPTPASRVWEKPHSRHTGEVLSVCRSDAVAVSSPEEAEGVVLPVPDADKTALGEVNSLRSHTPATRGVHRVASLTRPLVKPWVGPIPPPRMSPTRTLGHLLPPEWLAVGASSSQSTAAPLTSGLAVQPAEPTAVQTFDPTSSAAPSLARGPMHLGRPLRMANLGRWLGHMWKRVQPEENPNPTRSFAAVVRSPVMSRRDASSALSGAAAGRQPPSSAPPPIARSPSGGAPGLAPGVYQPIQAVQTAAPQAVLTPSHPAPVQLPSSQVVQATQPHQFAGYHPQQPQFLLHAGGGYVQQQKHMSAPPRYHALPDVTQQQFQHLAAGPPVYGNAVAGVPAAARPRKQKGGKGGRIKPRQGAATQHPALPQVVTAAPIFASAQPVQSLAQMPSLPAVTATQMQFATLPLDAQHIQSTGAVQEASVPKKLWCFKCQSAGHKADDCETQQYCFIYNKTNHPMTMRRCPALKLPKPAAMLCGYGTETMAFFQMPDNVCREDLSQQDSRIALVSISGGSLSANIVELEVAKIARVQHEWNWETVPHGEDAFLMSFPSEEVLQRVTGFAVFLKSHNVTIEFKPWKSEAIPHRFELISIWVHVHGVPHALRHFLGLWAVGSVIGATLDVDLLCLRRRGIVRIQVAVLNLDAFKRSTIDSLSSDVVIQRKGYEFRYSLEKEDFRVDADFVPRVWEHGDDSGGDKGHERDDTVGGNDTSKRPKPTSSSSNNTSAPPTSGGVVPMQMAIAVTPSNPHRGLPATAASSSLMGSSSPVPATSSNIASPTTLAPRSSTPPSPTHWLARPHLDDGGHMRPIPEGMATTVVNASAPSPPPSPTPVSLTRRGVIFSPSIRACQESARAELRVLSSTPPSPGGRRLPVPRRLRSSPCDLLLHHHNSLLRLSESSGQAQRPILLRRH